MAANNAYRAKAWECLSLAECMNDPEERAERVRFARMWMNLAETIDEFGKFTYIRSLKSKGDDISSKLYDDNLISKMIAGFSFAGFAFARWMDKRSLS